LKFFITIFLIVGTLAAFSQESPYAMFRPRTFSDIFPPNPPHIVLDPNWNVSSAPAPYDRFFYIDVYIKDTDPQVLCFGLLDKIIAGLKTPGYTGTENSKFDAVWVTLANVKNPLSAAPTDAKKGYSEYEIMVPPLSPQGQFKFEVFQKMTDDELAQITNVLFAIYHERPDGGTHVTDIATLLQPFNHKKKLRGDEWELSKEDVWIYYIEKVRNQVMDQGLSDDQVKLVISNIVHSDIGVTANYNPVLLKAAIDDPTQHVNYEDTVHTAARPILFDTRSINKLDFNSFVIDTRTTSVVTVDAGFIGFGLPQNGFFRGSSYIGVDIYFRAFDPTIPFRYAKMYKQYTGLRFIDKFSLNFGVTLNSQAKQYYRADLFGSDNLMVGLGYRINNLFKINAGGLLYYKLNPNFLLSDKAVNAVPYIGASMDIRIGTIFSNFSKLFSL